MPNLEKYSSVTCLPTQETSDWKIKKERPVETESSRYKLIKLERLNQTVGKTALAIAMTLISPVLFLCSSGAKKRFNKYLENCWSGREVKRFKIDETKLMLLEKAQKLAEAEKLAKAEKAQKEAVLAQAKLQEASAAGVVAQAALQEASALTEFNSADVAFKEAKVAQDVLKNEICVKNIDLEIAKQEEHLLKEALKANQRIEADCKNSLELLVEKQKKAELMLAASEKVLEAAKALENALEDEIKAKEHHEVLKRKEAELEIVIQKAKSEEKRAESLLAEITDKPEIINDLNAEPPILEKALETLKNLSDICIGERIDVNEEGNVLEPSYKNNWSATFWRSYHEHSVKELAFLTGTFSTMIKSLEALDDSEQAARLHLMLNAIDGLRTLKNDYFQSGKTYHGNFVNKVALENLGLIKALLSEKLNSLKGPEFQKYQPFARRVVYLFYMLNYSKESAYINELYAYVRNAQLNDQENTKEKSLIALLEQVIDSKSSAKSEQASQLEASVIDSPNGMVVTDTLPYIVDKIKLFMALYVGEAKMDMTVWDEFLKQLEMPKKVLDYLNQNYGKRVHLEVQIKAQLRKFAKDYLNSLDKKPEGVGIFIPVGFIYPINKNQGGHFAPTSILKLSDGYYLCQHNAGPGALKKHEDNGKEFVGYTTVPVGPFKRKEVKNFIAKALNLTMTPFESQKEALEAFKNLFDAEKIITTNSIPKRPFQHIGNCSVRGFIEWIIFASQRLNQVDVVNEFIKFNLFKSRERYTKAPVEPLLDNQVFESSVIPKGQSLRTSF